MTGLFLTGIGHLTTNDGDPISGTLSGELMSWGW